MKRTKYHRHDKFYYVKTINGKVAEVLEYGRITKIPVKKRFTLRCARCLTCTITKEEYLAQVKP